MELESFSWDWWGLNEIVPEKTWQCSLNIFHPSQDIKFIKIVTKQGTVVSGKERQKHRTHVYW